MLFYAQNKVLIYWHTIWYSRWPCASPWLRICLQVCFSLAINIHCWTSNVIFDLLFKTHNLRFDLEIIISLYLLKEFLGTRLFSTTIEVMHLKLNTFFEIILVGYFPLTCFFFQRIIQLYKKREFLYYAGCLNIPTCSSCF
jgi:hypothetical protein